MAKGTAVALREGSGYEVFIEFKELFEMTFPDIAPTAMNIIQTALKTAVYVAKNGGEVQMVDSGRQGAKRGMWRFRRWPETCPKCKAERGSHCVTPANRMVVDHTARWA